MSVEADTSINYSCQAEMDGPEEYRTKEERTVNGNGVLQDVKKTRTVTDWSPFNGAMNSYEIVAVYNGYELCGYDLTRTIAACTDSF